MQKIFYILFLLAIQPLFIAAQCNHVLHAIVTNELKNPISGASIKIENSQTETKTTKSGFFQLSNICTSTIQISIQANGYKTIQQIIHLPFADTLFVELNPINNLKEVVVKGILASKQTNIQQELKAKDLEYLRGLTFGDAVASIPGVSVLQTGSTVVKPVIHGLHSSRILIVNNGIRQEGQQWGSEHAPEVDVFLAEKITVVKGAGALQFGSDAIAGAIFAEPKALPTKNKLQTTINTIYFSNNKMGVVNAMLENAFKKNTNIAWRLQASAKYGGNSKTPNYWLHNTGVQEYNASGMVGIKNKRSQTEFFASIFNTQLGIFWGSHIGSITDLNNAINRKEPLFNINAFTYTIDRPKQQVQHIVAKAKYNYVLDSTKQLNVLFSYQENKRQEYDLAKITNLPELDLRIGTALADANFLFVKKHFTYTVGLNYMLQNNVWQGSRFFIPNFTSNNLAAYAFIKSNKLKTDAELGVRFDYKDLQTFRNSNNIITSNQQSWNGFSATAAYNKKISTSFSWLFNAALAWRAPNVSELYTNGLHHGTSSFEIGNPNLQTEQAFNFSTQLKYKQKDSLLFVDITFYNNHINNFINLVPDTPATLTIRGAFPTFKYVQTNAVLSGIDAVVGSRITHQLLFFLKTSILQARDIGKNTWLAQMPSNRVGLQLQYQFKNSKTFSSNYVKLYSNTVFQQTNLPLNNPDYLLPPPTFTVLNVDATTTTQINKNAFTIGVSVYNLMNTVFRDYMNRFRYFSDEIGTNIAIRLKYTL